MKNVRIIILCIALVATIGFGAHQGHAQYMRMPAQLTLEAYPPFPAPNTVVTVSLSSYGTDIDDASIEWTIDGVTASTSRNARSIEVPTGDGEKVRTIQARISSTKSGTRTLTKTLAPGAVDIVVEPQTTVPDGFRGRALPTPDSQVRVIAVPHLYKNGSRVPASETRFTWFVNGSMMFGGAQLGTNVTTVSVPRYGNLDVTVIAESKDGSRSARSSVSVKPDKPRMAYYELSSLYGLIMEAPRRFTTSKDELSVVAVPYYMNEGIGTGAKLTHTWTEDGTIAPLGTEPHIMTVTRGTGRPARHIDHTYTSEAYEQIRGVGSFDVTFTDETNALPTI